jgi:hypothetical protein
MREYRQEFVLALVDAFTAQLRTAESPVKRLLPDAGGPQWLSSRFEHGDHTHRFKLSDRHQRPAKAVRPIYGSVGRLISATYRTRCAITVRVRPFRFDSRERALRAAHAAFPAYTLRVLPFPSTDAASAPSLRA